MSFLLKLFSVAESLINFLRKGGPSTANKAIRAVYQIGITIENNKWTVLTLCVLVLPIFMGIFYIWWILLTPVLDFVNQSQIMGPDVLEIWRSHIDELLYTLLFFIKVVVATIGSAIAGPIVFNTLGQFVNRRNSDK